MVDHKFGLVKYDGDVPRHIHLAMQRGRNSDGARKEDVIMQFTNKMVDG